MKRCVLLLGLSNPDPLSTQQSDGGKLNANAPVTNDSGCGVIGIIIKKTSDLGIGVGFLHQSRYLLPCPACSSWLVTNWNNWWPSVAAGSSNWWWATIGDGEPSLPYEGWFVWKRRYGRNGKHRMISQTPCNGNDHIARVVYNYLNGIDHLI